MEEAGVPAEGAGPARGAPEGGPDAQGRENDREDHHPPEAVGEGLVDDVVDRVLELGSEGGQLVDRRVRAGEEAAYLRAVGAREAPAGSLEAADELVVLAGLEHGA